MISCPWLELQASIHQVLNKCVLSREPMVCRCPRSQAGHDCGKWSNLLHNDLGQSLALLGTEGIGPLPHVFLWLLQGVFPAQGLPPRAALGREVKGVSRESRDPLSCII